MAPPVLICDFDGTLTNVDLGDALCDRFAPPEWRDIDAAWVRGELSLPEAQRRIWSMVRASREELLDAARELGAPRSGADALFDAARRGDLTLVIASGGFDLYIDALLAERARDVEARYHNRLTTRDDRTVVPEFLEGMGCGRCAVCKGVVVRRYLREHERVAFCGDGASDRCAARAATDLFVIEGGELARHCAEEGIDYLGVRDLRAVVEVLCG